MQLPDSDAFMADISSVRVNKNLFFYRYLYETLNQIKFNVEMYGLSQVNYVEKREVYFWLRTASVVVLVRSGKSV